ncbi:MAG: putative porin [Bacteroidales bacterium]|nr:putative porin [Bacteroidales bacterium]
MKIRRPVFLIAFIFLIPFLSIAQDKKEKEKTIVIDTGLTFTRYTTLPLSNQPFQLIDKTIDEIRHVNAIYRIENMFYQQLSTDGSPHKPLLFQLPNLHSFNYQPSVYDAAKFTRENIKFYNVFKPYSELRYSNTLNTSRYFSVIHAQNVYKNIHLGFQYDVNYTTGSFDKSQIMNQFFNATLRFKNKKETYEGYLGFVRNRAMQNESGGLKSDSSFAAGEFSSLNAYPVNLSMAYSKWKSVDAFLVQKFNFGKLIKDSSFISNLSLVHELSYFSNARLYVDANPMEGFYQQFYFDTLKTNDSLSTQRIQNSLSIRNEKTIPFEIGIKHDYVLFADSLNNERSSNFTPFVNLGLDISGFKLNFLAEYIISNNRYNEDFQIGGNVEFKNLYANLRLMNKSVDYFYNRYWTNNFKWENNFSKTNMFNTNLGYNHKEKLAFNIGYFLLNDLVYINNNLLPQQTSKPTSIIQASLLHNLKLGIFNLKGVMTLQKLSSEEAIRVPVFQAKQGISINFKMFNQKLQTQVGFDFRYNTSYFADSFMPAMGAFVQQDKVKIGNYLFTDFFVQAQIDRVKFFVALCHPYAGVFGNEYYLTPHYPSEKLNLRYGVTWMFFD